MSNRASWSVLSALLVAIPLWLLLDAGLQERGGERYGDEAEARISFAPPPMHNYLQSLYPTNVNLPPGLVAARLTAAQRGEMSAQNFVVPVPLNKTELPHKTWVSMGLCFSRNTRLHGKSKYPYAQVTPLSILLWKYFLPEVGVLVRLIYTETEVNSVMEEYAGTLRRAGAEVILSKR